MTNPVIEKALHEELERLPPSQQKRVLEFARSLVSTRPRGVPGSALIRFGGTIEPDDLTLMERAINESCEQVNPDEW